MKYLLLADSREKIKDDESVDVAFIFEVRFLPTNLFELSAY